jgi:predicted transcriptional regulator
VSPNQWTTREIGEEMGISAASVSRLLKSHRRPQDPAVGSDRVGRWFKALKTENVEPRGARLGIYVVA